MEILLPSTLAGAAVFALVLGWWTYRRAPRELTAVDLLADPGARARARGEGALLRAVLPPVPGLLREGVDLEALDGRLAEAGSPYGLSAEQFLRLKLVAALLVAVIAALLVLESGTVVVLLVGLAAGAGAYRLPDVWISSIIDGRVKQLDRALPNMVDSLVLALEAGLDLEGALKRMTPRQRGPIREALDQVLAELGAGYPLGTALGRLGARTRSAEFRGLLALIQQSRRLGVGISAGLRVRAQELRTKRRLQAQEAAQRAPLKILFPLVLFFLPALLLVFIAPALLAVFGGA